MPEVQKTKMTDADLELINRLSKRDLTADEVYTFSAVAADSQVDRDYEYFTPETLEQLSKLFVGTTIISDHDPKAGNQTARVFAAHTNLRNDGVTQLIVDAYTLKDGNEDFIQRIESGIVKEVSIACSVSSRLCSVCGKNYGYDGCRHQRGKTYDGTECVVALSGAADAYEISFVAVPAQREAGVIRCRKSFDISGGQQETENDHPEKRAALKKRLEAAEKFIKETDKNGNEQENV